jgi:phosphoenolpyruvate synthase/pyruvate phosphate dikinase
MTISEILDLNDISAGMIGDVGGKAANLGELTRAGFPVPPGFCVTTDAYRRLAAAAGLDTILGTATGDELPAAARSKILETPVPDGLASAIVGAYRALGTDVMVAVRSSATAEDLPFASFAGQQDTYLGVQGADAVLDAVHRCWASLWTDRAVSYRTSQGIDHAGVRLAVVVQTMVHSQVAGVLFTANPVTGRRHEAVIDASPGLGEAVVSGAVTPDHLVVDTATLRILERRSGDKRFAIHALPGGGTQQISLAPGAGLCVTDRQVTDLAVLGDRVETHYGAPQDIEPTREP